MREGLEGFFVHILNGLAIAQLYEPVMNHNQLVFRGILTSRTLVLHIPTSDINFRLMVVRKCNNYIHSLSKAS